MRSKTWVLLTILLCGSVPASADYVTVYGGPTYTPGVGGFKDAYATGVNNVGMAIGTAHKYDASDMDLGERAFRWDGSGTSATELGNLGADVDGVSYSYANAINAAGTVVGIVDEYDGMGEYLGTRAVRWDASSTAASELESLGTDGSGVTYGEAYDINDAGIIVGYAQKYDGSGGDLGDRPVRWEASSTVAIELESLGTDLDGVTFGSAFVINDAGTVAGGAVIYDSAGAYIGSCAVRWEASSTVAIELEHPDTDLDGVTHSDVYAISNAGTVVGDAYAYDSEGVYQGRRAIRWDTSGTAATELEILGADASGYTQAQVEAINAAGTIVGIAEMYDGSGEYLGFRAVRWEAASTAVTELGNLGSDASGFKYSYAYDIIDAGIAVGYSAAYDGSGTLLGDRAVYWDRDGSVVDLNTLIDPLSGWTLESADAISDTGWIAGSGMFDPDGLDGQEAYQRMFLLQLTSRPGDFDFDGDVDGRDFLAWQRNPSVGELADWQANYGTGQLVSESVAVPEPSSPAVLTLAVPVLLRRHRQPACAYQREGAI